MDKKSVVVALLSALVLGLGLQACAQHDHTQAAQLPTPPPQSVPGARAVVIPAPPLAPPPSDARNPDRLFQNGHTANVTAVAFSPDGQRLASGSEDKTVRIWNLVTAREVHVLTGHTEPVMAVAFSPDGSRVASASADHTLRIWDVATGALISAFSLQAGEVQAVTFSPDGRLLAASAAGIEEGAGSVIEIRDTASGAMIRRITLDWNEPSPLVITADGRLLSSGGAGEDSEIVSTKIWDLKSGRELQSFPISVQAITPDGRWGVSLEHTKKPTSDVWEPTLAVWDLAKGTRVCTIAVPDINVARLAVTPDGARILAIRLGGGEAKVYDRATGKEIKTLTLPAEAMGFCGDGQRLAASSESSVNIWDVSSGAKLQVLSGQLGAQDVAFSGDGKTLITAGNTLGVWSVQSGQLLKILEGGAQTLVYSPDGRWLATNPGGTLSVWDTGTWTPANIAPPERAYVWWMGFSTAEPHGDLTSTRVRSWRVGGPGGPILWGGSYASALSPDGKLLATVAAQSVEVSVWETSSGRKLRTWVAHTVGVNYVAFSPDGKWLLTAGQESRINPADFSGSLTNMKRSIKLWAVGTWEERLSLPFTGIDGGLGRFSPDGHLLAVTMPNFITLYSVPDGRRLGALAGCGPGAFGFSPDNSWLAQGGPSGICLWEITAPGK